MKKKSELISQREFARREGISHTHVRRYIQAGMPTQDGGKIDPAKAAEWLDQNTLRSASPSTLESFSAARARKEAALASLREIELQVKRGELVNADEAAAAWAEVGRRIRDSIMAIPTRVVNRLPAEMRREVFTAANEEVRALLKACSDDIRASGSSSVAIVSDPATSNLPDQCHRESPDRKPSSKDRNRRKPKCS